MTNPQGICVLKVFEKGVRRKKESLSKSLGLGENVGGAEEN